MVQNTAIHLAIRAATYLWVLPTTLPGLLAAVAGLLTGGRARWVHGVIEVHGGVVSVLLRRAVPLKGGARAMALGHVVLGLDQHTLDATRLHERVHVRQAELWGPLFIPAYLIASVVVWLRGGNAYLDNPFERQAYALDRAVDAQRS
jgi:hypothetical protein